MRGSSKSKRATYALVPLLESQTGNSVLSTQTRIRSTIEKLKNKNLNEFPDILKLISGRIRFSGPNSSRLQDLSSSRGTL